MSCRALVFLVCSISMLFSVEATQFFSDMNDQGLPTRTYSSDGSVDYAFRYLERGVETTNRLTGEVLLQEMNEDGEVSGEVFPSGLSIRLEKDGNRLTRVVLPDSSSIEYQYEGGALHKIVRRSEAGGKLYEHTYTHVSEERSKDKLIGELGAVKRCFDSKTGQFQIQSPAGLCRYSYDQNLILVSRMFKDIVTRYKHSEDGQLVVAPLKPISVEYDAFGRLISKNDKQYFRYDALNSPHISQ